MGIEEIVLLNPAGEAIGTAPKAASHHRNTPYHLAFSCYVTDGEGRVLITRRALDKATFPGVWTNTCCGHPAPGESLRQAVARRLETELGLTAEDLTLVLPEFDYRATAPDGTVEHERCPVVRARWSGRRLRPNPAEVADARWQTWAECLELAGAPEASPWFRMQMAQLAPLGSPEQWPGADPSRLPPALSW
ncbi:MULTISPECIES: isopentenyl-diphosphate Delta-isomerase [Thermomonospora]|uniref:Isopentenyl-diphosphate Delta-isomerase n=1 Tax=Thermomonospora curvata (strain ATCC 19995 / DSM 43183 / JCM 3096 / KCTC 9072 / NBRC 15933 / NCIMB 10081 / Henssen B9) TaxID=471852 RepID=D1AC62_THECD|nr:MULTISPECIES: isopentenyl-diphosphate Delta-isomerase [Thermomonospora]ACY97328.1 isopentenyl-diphosphate delta-isomerase, type 1 [Thermomonospora curvata DSM 43183]PKK14692.1 MAG: isopentenyl-diphosphate Delta-isomerase [Thermomonospora sp. CIF 1]